jgi:uncharacterized protein YukE
LLSQVATVVKVKSTGLGLRRQDKQAAKESARSHNADTDIVNVNVIRLAGRGKDLVDALGKKVKEAQNDLAAITTAWEDDRLLANALYDDWLKIWGKHENEYNAIRQELIDNIPHLIAEAESRKGSYRVEPPTEEELREAFSMTFTMRAVPDAGAYTAMDKQMEHVLRARFEADTQAAYQAAQRDALQRLAKPLGHLIDRMGVLEKDIEDKANGHKGGARIYESVITNVQDIAAVFGTFNLTGDPHLQAIAEKLEAFDGIEIDDLKRSESLRKDTVKKAEDIMARLSDWL